MNNAEEHLFSKSLSEIDQTFDRVCNALIEKQTDYKVLKKQYDELLEKYLDRIDKSEKTCAECNIIESLCEDNKKLRLENYSLQKKIIELESPYKREPRDIDDLIKEIKSFNPKIGFNCKISAETMRDWCVEAIELWRMGYDQRRGNIFN